MIAKGRIPSGASTLLSASRLIAIPKSNGDVRPIAIGESLRRLTAKTICIQKKNSFAQFFSPLQHGVAVQGGSALLVHHLQLLLDSHPDSVIVKTDIRNAINYLDRSCLLDETAKSFPDLYEHVFSLYSQSSPPMFQQGSSSFNLLSQQGVHQGDPLEPALFSIAIQPILAKVQELHSATQLLAYLDDVFVIGSHADVLLALDALKASLSAIGLHISMEKCELFGSTKICSLQRPEGIKVSSYGTTILGVAVGHVEYIAENCLDFAKSGQTLCDQFLSLEDVQSGCLLLRYCHVAHMNHLIRSVNPEHVRSAVQAHNSLTKSTFIRLVQCPDPTSKQWLQATLPIRHGGYGLTNIESLSADAFVAGWAQSIQALPARFPSIANDIFGLPIEGRMGIALKSSIPDNHSLADILSDTKYLQCKLSLERTKHTLSTFIQELKSMRDKTRLRSLQGRGAGAWLDAIPTSTKFALSSGDYRLATREVGL